MQTRVHNTDYRLFCNSLIPSDLVKCSLATLTKAEKLRKDLSVITICLAKSYVYGRP